MKTVLQQLLGGDPVTLFLATKSDHTRRAYGKALADFLGWSGMGGDHFLSLPSHHAYAITDQWRSVLMAGELSANTILQRIAAIRSFRSWGAKVGASSPLPTLDNLPAASPYKDTRGTSPDNMKGILGNLKKTQDKVIWGFLFLMGLRRAEVVEIDCDDIDLAAGTVAIRGKGKRDKVAISIPQWLLTQLEILLVDRADGALILNPSGGRMTGDGLYRRVKKWGEMVGISGLRPHKVRHTAITAALDNSAGNVRKVAVFGRIGIDSLKHYDDNRKDFFLECSNLLVDTIGL